ncbi:MAG: peptidylprolyl isomerase [Pseudomonas sp.]
MVFVNVLFAMSLLFNSPYPYAFPSPSAFNDKGEGEGEGEGEGKGKFVLADTIRIRIVTELGDVTAELYTKAAPVSTGNFLRYVDAGLYDGAQFHRAVRADNQADSPVKITVVQAAADRARARGAFPAIPLERTSATGLRHLDGTLSMARAGVDSGTHEFFICIGDQPELDFGGKRNADGQGFAAFGRVVEGMDVVRRMNAAPAQAQRLTPPIRILRIERVRVP